MSGQDKRAGTVIRWSCAGALALGLMLAAALAASGKDRIRETVPVGEIVSAQITNLKSPDFTVRRCAARALGRIGPRAKDALPALREALDDAEPTVRDAAKIAIDRIEPSAKNRPAAGATLGAIQP